MDRRGVVFWLSASHRRRLSDGDGKGTTPAVAPAALPQASDPKLKAPAPPPTSTIAAKESRKRSKAEVPPAAPRLSEEGEEEDAVAELVRLPFQEQQRNLIRYNVCFFLGELQRPRRWLFVRLYWIVFNFVIDEFLHVSRPKKSHASQAGSKRESP